MKDGWNGREAAHRGVKKCLQNFSRRSRNEEATCETFPLIGGWYQNGS